MATAVAKLLEYEKTEQEKAVAKFEQLVDRMEAGEEIDERKALAILNDAGKSLANIENELSRRRRVAELRRTIDDAGDLVARSRELNVQLAEKKREIEETESRLHGEKAAIEREQLTLSRRMMEIDKARGELARLSPPPANELERQRAIGSVRADICHLEAQLGGRTNPDLIAKQIAGLSDEAAELERQVAKMLPLTVMNMFAHRRLKRKLADVATKRRELETRLRADSRHIHDFRRLESLREKLGELSAEGSNG